MAFLAPDIDLEELWKERSEATDFKMRDQAYKVHENAYLARTTDGERQNITWRPIMLDGQVGDTRGREPINLTKQIGLHHTAAAAIPPRTWNEPGEEESEETAQKNTALIQRVFDESGVKQLQTKQSHSLAVLGDAPYGVVFKEDAKRGDRCLWMRVVDPSYCYPGLDDNDPGRLLDMLITYEVRRGWAERAYGVSLNTDKSHVRLFEYYDDEYRTIQIEKVRVHTWTLHHDLGFTPWYWCFNQVPGMYAQADVAETPKLQGTMNELLILALDALRRNIDKSYYATGHKGTVEPKPGKVVGFPNPNVKIDEFPTAVPPGMITELMQYIQGNAQSMGGISPISMEGMAGGSIVTGSAVRHQVEAIEARAKAKHSNLESCYAWIGQAILKIYSAKFPDREMKLRLSETRKFTHTGSQVGDWTRCVASYGGADGLPQGERQNWAMSGLGRVHGRRTAIGLVYPERDVESVEQEIDSDQLHSAELTAKAQLAAQQVVQSGQGAEPSGAGQPPVAGASGPAPTPPQVPQRAQQPGAAMLGGRTHSISDMKLMIQLVDLQTKLKGDVYAVGELAIVGMARFPEVAVTDERDRAPVQSGVAAQQATVRVGVSEDEPKVQLNA
jgi:hypothetical protein